MEVFNPRARDVSEARTAGRERPHRSRPRAPGTRPASAAVAREPEVAAALGRAASALRRQPREDEERGDWRPSPSAPPFAVRGLRAACLGHALGGPGRRATMAEQPRERDADRSGDLERFLQQHPSLRVLPPGNRVRCKLTGHELPCRLPELQAFTAGKKYLRLSKVPGVLDYSDNQLFCKLTLRHLNKIPEHVLRHVQGRRYQKALRRYEECQKEGLEYVPACLLQKRRKPRQETDNGLWEGKGKPRQRGAFWEPPPSDEGASDTDDSLSDLYPAKLFPEKSATSRETPSDFMSDSDEEVAKPVVENGGLAEAMEVDSQAGTKRGKKQAGPRKKKFKRWNRKSKKLWKKS
ncbi:surfeit locus protein 2 isoform 2-T3 [Liasis olivaceus]